MNAADTRPPGPKATRPSRLGRRHDQMGPDTAERISAGCYGALVAASTLVGLGTSSPDRVALLVVLTNVVYYATHVFAYTIGDRDEAGHGPWKIVKHHLRVGAPMVSVSFTPAIVVFLLMLLGVDQESAILGGVITAALFLATVATTGAFLRGLRPFAVFLTALATIVVAVLIVIVKLSLH